VPPTRTEGMVRPKRIAEGVVLKVNESAVVWGGGRLGGTVRDTLIALGSFDQVYFPVEPRNPPPLRLVIEASGTVQEEVGVGILKSFIIGCLAFIPVGIIRFDKTFELDATVVLLKEGQELRRFHIKSSTGVSHTMFSEIEEYEPAAQTAAFRDLGERIASELSGLAVSSNAVYGCI